MSLRSSSSRLRLVSAIAVSSLVVSVLRLDPRLLTPKPLTALGFPDSGHGWVAGWQGAICATTDGGTSWSDASSGSLADDLAAMDLRDPVHGCLVCRHGGGQGPGDSS
jgi:hypothetical protein